MGAHVVTCRKCGNSHAPKLGVPHRCPSSAEVDLIACARCGTYGPEGTECECTKRARLTQHRSGRGE